MKQNAELDDALAARERVEKGLEALRQGLGACRI